MTFNFKFPLSRFILNEESMMPTYKPGDHVLTFSWIRPKVNDVIVFEIGDKKYLKRINKISGDLIYVVGDNRKESAKFGSIGTRQIIGKVVIKY